MREQDTKIRSFLIIKPMRSMSETIYDESTTEEDAKEGILEEFDYWELTYEENLNYIKKEDKELIVIKVEDDLKEEEDDEKEKKRKKKRKKNI
jgi:hypothetical protein